MSIKEEILEILNTQKFYYKGIPMNAFFLPVFNNNKKQTVRNQFNNLYKDGYIDKINEHYIINKNGKEYLHKNKKRYLKNFNPTENNGPKNLLLLYDIPEDKKSERDWFRRTLIKFGFIMIQRSVWVGPSPLPKEFLDYVKLIGLKDSTKTFKLENDYKLHK
ncbi:MAG: CRISPR-associated endonuclease Cas2 [Candidatus Pacebacteria bacterium]|nr:CRISPR-associated endonuclease Cas2 [Candidatus Paceibacterota bacterium]